MAHPALVESRQQRLTLARMLTAFRLPDADERRPQRRGCTPAAVAVTLVLTSR